MTYESLMIANQTITKIEVKGKEYAEVNQRIRVFRMLYPNGSIETNIESLEKGICVMSAVVKDDFGSVLGVGHAYEKEDSSFINKTSYIENCETSAVGRALFRKLPTDRSNAYADEPVKKSKEEYTRAQWQIDAHAYWRSSGDRLISKEELKELPVESLQQVYRQYSRETVYNYVEHVKLAEDLDKNDKLPAIFMVVAPGAWNQMEVWNDINRMRTLNTNQSRRRAQMHVCPLQLDIVERIINRYSNKGDLVYDPFGGLMTVPMTAVKMHRKGYGCELNPDYFRDGVGYLQEAENEVDAPTLFDFIKEPEK